MLSTLPATGLQNCLRSHASSTHLSIRGHNLYAIESEHGTRPVSLPRPVSAHAAGADDIFASVEAGHVVVHDVHKKVTIRSKDRLHFDPQDMAVCRYGACDEWALVGVAGYDGVFCVAFGLDDRRVEGPHALSGSRGYACVCVDVRADGRIAAGAMDGRVAIWDAQSVQQVVRGVAPDGSAMCILGLPEDCGNGDRISQMMFVSNGAGEDCLLVAWWSGRLMKYVCTGLRYCMGWEVKPETKEDYDFRIQVGPFIAVCGHGTGIAFSRSGELYYIALATGEKQRLNIADGKRKMIKGLAATLKGIVVWMYDMSELEYVDWPNGPLVASGNSTEYDEEIKCASDLLHR